MINLKIALLVTSLIFIFILFGCVGNEKTVQTNTSFEPNKTICGGDIGVGCITKENVNSSEIQLRVEGACGPGYAIREILEDGSVVCEKIPNGSKVVINQSVSLPDKLNVSELCLNGSCRSSWPKPTLSDVLSNGNDADGKNITNVGKLNVSEICLNNKCIKSWNELRMKVKSSSCSKIDGTKICTLGNHAFCVLSGVDPYNENWNCRVYENDGLWYLKVQYVSSCYVQCMDYTK